ncbi:MAG: SdrD B-like domain-containing protein, partial [Anaerolineae bacterium]|nr:SdrD B-like domain-containing protein [Anaerolineae bacterium]
INDTIDPQLEITQINASGWSLPATLEYSTDGVTYISLGIFQDGVALSSPGDFPTNVANLRWSFTGSVPFGFSGQAEVVFTPRNSGSPLAVSGNSYQNCIAISADAPATPVNDCSSVTIDDNSVVISPVKTTVGANTVRPSDVLTFNLRLRVDERSSVALLNPTVIEALPDSLEYITDTNDPDYSVPVISFTNVVGGEQVQPTLTIQNNVTIDGTLYATVLVWTWPPGYFLTPPAFGVSDINIQFSARVRPGTLPATYPNLAYFVSDSPDMVCDTGTPQTDTEDLDGDSNTAEDRCRVTVNYDVQETVVLSSQKWISNPSYQLDSTFTGFLDTVASNPPAPSASCPSSTFGAFAQPFTRFPCVTQGFPDNTNFVPPNPDTFDDFYYWLTISNEGNVEGSNYILYDILPYVGDTGSGGPLFTSARESEFTPYIIGPVTIESLPAGLNASDITIEYSNSSNPCRTEVFNDNVINNEPAGCVNDWTTTPPPTTSPNTVRAFRIRFNNTAARFPVLSTMQFSVPMRISEDAQSGQIAWNSFAQRASNPTTGRIPTSEPRKVGIIVPERMSVGNYVWYDYNNDGTPVDDSGAAEAPVVGATISLYRDADNNGTPDSPIPVATDTTDTNGYYLFSDIVYDGSDPTQNRYVIAVDETNFNFGNPIFAHLSSTGTNSDNQTDLDDNGIDDLNPAASAFGILGPSFELSINTEPTGETQLSGDDPNNFPTGNYPDGPFSRGVRAEPDNNSDLTIDFGFYVPMSIGNRVWFDTGAGVLTNNGLEDPSESANGVAAVALTLYRDDGNGTFGAGDTVYATTTTDANGYYLFDNLPPGDYFVAVDQSNFDPGGVLRAHEDSDNSPNVDVDRENKGANDTFLGSSGVVSTLVTLAPFTEPVLGVGPNDEVDQTTPTGFTSPHGNTGELDDNSNLTIDFGFWSPGMALGNFVWEDADNDNVFDVGETGLNNITINLYQDMDEDGVPDGIVFATTVTTLGGFYLFDNLAPGGYIVEIPASEFNAGGDLVGYISSNRNDTIDTLVPPLTSPTGDFATDWDDQQDDGLNQSDAAGYLAFGIRSETVTLVPVSEPFDVDGSEPDGGLGIGAGGKDENSDLTVDFGVFQPLSIGNRVWRDDYSSGDGVTIKGDGIFDMINESPVDGITLTLFKLNDGGNPNNIADYSIVQFNGVNQVDSTDDGGYYLFDGLGEGTYRVRVDAANFAANAILENHRSSDGLNGADSTDSGIDDIAAATNGIYSEPVVLALGTEDTTETDANDAGQATNRNDGSLGFGIYEEQDDNSDLTVDFGFYIPPMSLGNRVWYDTNNNGLIDAGDDNPAAAGNPGIAGVTVNLYNASDTSTPIATDTTDANGYYLFDDLVPAGDYVVGIPVR